jgi:predicted nucleic acid-binding protein
MARGKGRRTITVDPAVTEVLGDDDEILSGAVNELLSAEVERRRLVGARAELLQVLAAERGPVDASEVEEFRRLGPLGALVLDSEAVAALARGGDQERTVRAALTAASEESADVVVPAAALAELYRGVAQDQAVDACLGADGGIAVVATDRQLARRIGKILADARLGSEAHADASVVAVCAAAGGGLILTGDARKLTELSGGSPSIVVRAIGAKWRPALFGTAAGGAGGGGGSGGEGAGGEGGGGGSGPTP